MTNKVLPLGGSAQSPIVLPSIVSAVGACHDQPALVPNPTGIDSQLNQLVQAMAAYSTGNSGLDSLLASNTQQPPVSQMVAAAWH